MKRDRKTAKSAPPSMISIQLVAGRPGQTLHFPVDTSRMNHLTTDIVDFLRDKLGKPKADIILSYKGLNILKERPVDARAEDGWEPDSGTLPTPLLAIVNDTRDTKRAKNLKAIQIVDFIRKQPIYVSEEDGEQVRTRRYRDEGLLDDPMIEEFEAYLPKLVKEFYKEIKGGNR